MTANLEFKTIRFPIYKGMWRLGGPNGLCISSERRPGWWQRYMMRVCFGWEWIDEPKKPEAKK